jgi:hypothetical protein
MSLKLPSDSDRLADWADEIINHCYVSREERRDTVKTNKAYYYTGSNNGMGVPYNKVFPHIDRLAAMLFSPSDVRFTIEFDETEPEAVHAMGRAAARRLNREFHACGIDLSFSQGVDVGLVEGCCLLKQLWGFHGLEAWLIHPDQFGVLREDISDLDKQEAFVFSSYLTLTQFERTIVEHPEREKIMEEIESARKNLREDESFLDSYFHQILVGGITPVQVATQAGSGMVGVVGVPAAAVDPKVVRSMVRIDELWVMDRDRQDYTTIRMVAPAIVIEGKQSKQRSFRGKAAVLEGRFKRRNLAGPGDMLNGEHEFKAVHPFTKICPNEIDGYFWGQSEVAQIYMLQDELTEALRDLKRMGRLSADPPKKYIGFSGMNKEKHRAFKSPGGFISEDNPNADVKNMADPVPDSAFRRIKEILDHFDDVAGFQPILQGEGVPGVRSESQVRSMTRNASPRLRDRSFLIERQCAEAGDFALMLLGAKKAEIMDTDTKGKFVLDQLPDDCRVSVDSHTSSPVFVEDNRTLAFALARSNAISPEDLIGLTHPPHEDTLRMHAKQRAAAEAELLKQHPELLTQKRGKKG